MKKLLEDLKTAREIARFGQEIVEVILEIGRLLVSNREERARALLDEVTRERVAGRARHEASRLAGPRR